MIIYEKSQPFNKHVNTKTREEYLCLQNVNRKLILMQCKRTILSCYAVANSVWNNDPYRSSTGTQCVWSYDLRKLGIQLKVIIIILRRLTVTIVSFSLVKLNKTD